MSAICDLWVNVLHCFHRPGLEIFNSIFKYCLCLLVIVLQFYLAEKKILHCKKSKTKPPPPPPTKTTHIIQTKKDTSCTSCD